MALLATVIALAAPGLHAAPCDRDCQAGRLDPPCVTTCTGSERRRLGRELSQLRTYERRLATWQRWAQVIDPYRDWLGRLRACESRDHWRIVNRFGYAGAYQFGGWAWHAAGGTGRPQDAHPLEQSFRAVLLRQRYGLSQWQCQVGA